MRFDDYKIQAYLDELAGPGAAPGGGSAAALIGSLGASLVSMVANLTKGRKKYAAVEADMQEILGEATALRSRLFGLVSEDTLVFDKVMAAYRLPKSTAAEKEERQQAIDDALRGACQVPLQIATSAVEVLRLAETVAQKGNTNAVSDAAVAGYAAHAAVHSALLNVRINLNSLPQDDWAQQMAQQVADLRTEADALQTKVQAICNKILDS